MGARYPLAPDNSCKVHSDHFSSTRVGYIPARYLNDLTEEIIFNVLRQPEASEEPVRIDNGGNGRITIKRRYDYEQILDHSWGYLIEASVSGGFSSTALVSFLELIGGPSRLI